MFLLYVLQEKKHITSSSQYCAGGSVFIIFDTIGSNIAFISMNINVSRVTKAKTKKVQHIQLQRDPELRKILFLMLDKRV